jgi:hypothetical protein
LQLLPNEREIEKIQIIHNLVSVGYSEIAIKEAIGILLEYALIESVEGVRESDVERLSISKKGIKYLDLINEFSYLLFVCDAVSKPSKYNKITINEKFGTESITALSRGDLKKKKESVVLFMDFIAAEERAEKEACPDDYKGLLNRIRGGEDGIATIMRERVDHTLTKLTSGHHKSTSRIPKLEFKHKGV